MFITSPSPENLKTLFEFIFKGFDALNYLDHVDYTIIQSTNPDYNKAIVRVNVHRQHRQTIPVYSTAKTPMPLARPSLLSLTKLRPYLFPLFRKLLGPYLVFMASTINGYEGTGRSLSLKLIQQLREQSRPGPKPRSLNDTETTPNSSGQTYTNGDSVSSKVRTLREIILNEPIRYTQGDSVEKWLNKVLCLDATLPNSKLQAQGCPHPSKCELLHVNRDTPFFVPSCIREISATNGSLIRRKSL